MDFRVDCLLFEGSRGCWWGQKQHCVFCGLNEELIKFRQKNAGKIFSELLSLSSKYQILDFVVTDWILSPHEAKPLFNQLRNLPADLKLFYAVRPDMSKKEIGLMRSAGVVYLLPGIESFSSDLLRLIRKATSRIRQVQFLRWCKEYGINVFYTILSQLPGDKAEWYLDMADFLPQILHLQPPAWGLNPVELYRFSPLFDQAHTFGVTEWQIRKDYCRNFPPGFIDLKKIAYFMNYTSARITPNGKYEQPLRGAIDRWGTAHKSKKPPVYCYQIGNGFLHVIDTRYGEGSYFDLEGLYKDILLLSDRIQSVNSLKKLLAPVYPVEVTDGRVEEAVEELVREDVLMQEGELVLSLPIGVKPRTTKELYARVLAISPSLEESLALSGNSTVTLPAITQEAKS